ncbi:hypothetical protein EDD18DRAFT_1114296 [Armillaria luteobubalina]|uniref:Uncharacterized protein n=1 Tax=Armillaria luteobubalina TaxID=153913 RepID=A0AA39UDB2_9AGAR|nr:hypothetical protein EDD18DRAFT_1114296 [Armillaria luteobubalina]
MIRAYWLSLVLVSVISPSVLPLPLSSLAHLSTATVVPLFKHKDQLSQHVVTKEAIWPIFNSNFIDEVQDIFEALGHTIDAIRDSAPGSRRMHCFVYKLRSNGNRNNVAKLYCGGRRVGSLYYSVPTEAEFIPVAGSHFLGTPRGHFVGDFYFFDTGDQSHFVSPRRKFMPQPWIRRAADVPRLSYGFP